MVTGTDFEKCFREHLPRLVALGETTTGNRDVARELAQEAFVRLHDNWDIVGGYDNPGAWLWRVMSNLLIDHHRSRASERRAVERLANRATPPTPTIADDDEWSELVAGLPPRQRLIVTLYYGDDQPVGAIADALDVSPKSVRSALSKARAALRARWDTGHA